MKIFLDVGAHIGQTAAEVVKPVYGFDRIVCFEPVPTCAEHIREHHKDPRLEILALGLSNVSAIKTIYGGAEVGASLFRDKKGIDASISQQCRFVRATDWINENLRPGDEVYMKLNVEGAEVEILDDLLASGALARIGHIMVDFDVRKIPGMKHMEHALRERLMQARGTRVYPADTYMLGNNHGERLHTWLVLAGCCKNLPQGDYLRSRIRLLRQRLRQFERSVRWRIKGRKRA
ncbi:MAG: FkbM family methyltransferase [Rhodocyclaceae bacterium]|nr:FkbM family methyltransferase [Rhodocyclaceae bacterium]